jgi:hypothetical protein
MRAHSFAVYYVRGRDNSRQMWLDVADVFAKYLKDEVVDVRIADSD